MGSIFNCIGSDIHGYQSYMYKPEKSVDECSSKPGGIGPYTKHIRSVITMTNRDDDNSMRDIRPPLPLPPPWGHRWGAAGLIVLAHTAQGLLLVCLVDNDKTLGFPKGRAERGDTSALCTALRDWTEETGLPTIPLQMDVEPFTHDGPHGEAHYFAGLWDELEVPAAWLVKDDLQDKSPITHAYWLPLAEAFQLQRFPGFRHCLLHRALRKLRLDYT